ncbi:MAG: hypothetical protein ABI461_23795 [Polyangiaceae bacterium]
MPVAEGGVMKKTDVAIVTPCGERWETMTPDGGGRFCASCDKVVTDLSSMSEARAKRLLASKGNLCVRYLFDEHGNIWFDGERPPLAARLLNRAKRGAIAAATITAPFALQACMGLAPFDEVPATQVDAGDVDAGYGSANPDVNDAGSDAAETNDDAGDAGAAANAGDDASDDPGDGGS